MSFLLKDSQFQFKDFAFYIKISLQRNVRKLLSMNRWNASKGLHDSDHH
ncbi:unnamed protein product [Medioppia subpectinata]|uniref:Uncharacterized protein n=1 Tax=Medioppia subpectinata TaxID=1979941 RepID=A0A7R9LMA8_9ACAR|nr:unnamed protein product [Medioppia subpectinata]CAG2119971.1 unnamed protein product [Medioppia subpectinata]